MELGNYVRMTNISYIHPEKAMQLLLQTANDQRDKLTGDRQTQRPVEGT